MNKHLFKIFLSCLLAASPLLANAQLTSYEYWFDDGIGGFEGSLSGSEVTQTLSIDTNALGHGLHTLHIRVRQSDGTYSPVYSSTFFKHKPEQGCKLEYWLDDDFSHRKYIPCSESGSGIMRIENQALDLSNATPGIHRLYYRIVSSSYGLSATNETPLMVKSRFNETGNTVVNAGKYWFDNEEPNTWAPSMPNITVQHSFNLRPDDFEVGQHVMYVAYANSWQVWSETNATYFYKSPNAPNKLRMGMMPDSETTEIVEIQSEPSETTYFDIQGRKLNEPYDALPQGIYIVRDGTSHKTIIKH